MVYWVRMPKEEVDTPREVAVDVAAAGTSVRAVNEAVEEAHDEDEAEAEEEEVNVYFSNRPKHPPSIFQPRPWKNMPRQHIPQEWSCERVGGMIFRWNGGFVRVFFREI